MGCHSPCTGLLGDPPPASSRTGPPRDPPLNSPRRKGSPQRWFHRFSGSWRRSWLVAVVLVVWQSLAGKSIRRRHLWVPLPPPESYVDDLVVSLDTANPQAPRRRRFAPVATSQRATRGTQACDGVVISHSGPRATQTLGTVRVFLLFSPRCRQKWNRQGCVLPVTRSGKVLPAIPIDGQERLGFANPGDGRYRETCSSHTTRAGYDGVLVLIPDAIGFEGHRLGIRICRGRHYHGQARLLLRRTWSALTAAINTRFASHTTTALRSCANGNTTSKDLQLERKRLRRMTQINGPRDRLVKRVDDDSL